MWRFRTRSQSKLQANVWHASCERVDALTPQRPKAQVWRRGEAEEALAYARGERDSARLPGPLVARRPADRAPADHRSLQSRALSDRGREIPPAILGRLVLRGSRRCSLSRPRPGYGKR